MVITVYSKQKCVPCESLKHWLNYNDIEFEERNTTVNSSFADDVRELGYQTVPVLLVDGKVFSTGFEPNKLQTLLH